MKDYGDFLTRTNGKNWRIRCRSFSRKRQPCNGNRRQEFSRKRQPRVIGQFFEGSWGGGLLPKDRRTKKRCRKEARWGRAEAEKRTFEVKHEPTQSSYGVGCLFEAGEAGGAARGISWGREGSADGGEPWKADDEESAAAVLKGSHRGAAALGLRLHWSESRSGVVARRRWESGALLLVRRRVAWFFSVLDF